MVMSNALLRLFSVWQCLCCTIHSLPIYTASKGPVTALAAGESISFSVYYSVANTYIAAGEASFETNLETLDNKAVYHVTARGTTLPFYDHFFKVRDVYETFIDTLTLLPYKSVRNITEGKYKKFEQVRFNKSANTVVTDDGVFRVPVLVHDIVSAMYYARNVDYSRLQSGDKINFNFVSGSGAVSPCIFDLSAKKR